ncbi:MAG: transposase [Eubacteriales bacterium]
MIKEDTKFDLYAYCLMDNHAHFIMKENEISISEIMKRLCGNYGAWYNYRHHRVGHVFQDRFKSENIERDTYFITVLKYILNNPAKANLVEEAQEYKWSSYREYIKKKTITDVKFFLEMLDKNERKAKKYFKEEMKKEEEQPVKLTIEKRRRTDTEAEEMIQEEMKKQGIENLGEMSLEKKMLFVKELKLKGVSSRQIIGITGLKKTQVIGI